MQYKRMKQRGTNKYLIVIRMAVLALALIAAPHASADFEAGQSAWDAGNLDEALSQWQDASNAGDRRAMLELGRLHRQGLGVLQDYVEAHKWLNLAASRGEATALEERDALAVEMTLAQLARAQQLAADWQPRETAKQTEVVSSAPAAAATQPPPGALRAAQSLLAALGYQPGPADGAWSETAQTAYHAFLRDVGLPQTDTLTPQALRAIQAAAEQQGVAPTEYGTTTAGAAPAPAPAATNVPPPVSPDVLHNAVQSGDIGILEAAIASGVDVDARDSQSWTALMHAVNQGSPLLVSLLLEAAADVNVRALDGATALFMATAHGHTEIIELLMKAGADVSIRGPQGKAPIEVAITRYGDANTARENGVSPALLALLEGRMWRDVQAELERKQQEAEAAIRKLTEEMVSIPGGEFRMGRRKGKGDDDEKPVRRVTVRAFKLGKHEVTFAQWDACVMGGGCNGYTPEDEGWGRGNLPIINVSWDDVWGFIDWLNAKTGGSYRLPTEAEWEYAARAGTKNKYSWGNDIGRNRANCDGCGSQWDNRKTAPVGSFPANPWGLHDMHGNVWEWVQDCYNGSYKGAPKDGSAWTSGDCSPRVSRGGSWSSTPRYLRSAYRNHTAHSNRNTFGFRLAQENNTIISTPVTIEMERKDYNISSDDATTSIEEDCPAPILKKKPALLYPKHARGEAILRYKLKLDVGGTPVNYELYEMNIDSEQYANMFKENAEKYIKKLYYKVQTDESCRGGLTTLLAVKFG